MRVGTRIMRPDRAGSAPAPRRLPRVQIGLVGAGNMGSALARGWGQPILATDSGSGRAKALAAELGGEALANNAELAQRADVVILAHKPAQLSQVAAEVAP